MELQEQQFGKYKYVPGVEESKPVAEWLATPEGHDWIDWKHMFKRNEPTHGFFTTKTPIMEKYEGRSSGRSYRQDMADRERLLRVYGDPAENPWPGA